MFRPWEVIRAFLSVFFVMLGIPIESYEHVLGPPRVSFDFENFFLFLFLKPFFNGLIGKIQNVKNVRSGVHFRHGWAHFQAWSNIFTPRATFTVIRAAEAPCEAIFD